MVVRDPMRFKSKLGIGSDAYTSLRIGKLVQQSWDIGGVAATSASIASSPAVAGSLFAGRGLFALIGLGGTSATPVGWVIAASVASAGAYYGLTRYLTRFKDARVQEIPRFLNTPLDLLGTAIFELLAPIATSIAKVDGQYHPRERAVIKSHFVDGWGLDELFVDAGLARIDGMDTEHTVPELTSQLAHYKQANPDCNYRHMAREIICFANEIAAADGILDQREERAVKEVEAILSGLGGGNLLASLRRIAKPV